MYKSPIEIICGQMQTKMEDDIFRAVQSYDIKVDKEELIKALKYDCFQYTKGYEDGKADAMDSIVHCKDCKHWSDGVTGCTDHVKCCKIGFYMVGENGYCVYGERKQDEQDSL